MRGCPPCSPARPGGRHALAHTLADDVAFHLGEGGLDLQEGPARRRGGVHGRVQCAESDAAPAEHVNEGDELAGEAAEPVEVEDDEDVASAQVVEAGGEIRAIGRGAGSVIFKHPFAAGGVECVELSVEDLATFGGGDASVADEAHGVDGPEKPFSLPSYRKEIIAGLSGRKPGQLRAAGRFTGESRQTRDFRGPTTAVSRLVSGGASRRISFLPQSTPARRATIHERLHSLERVYLDYQPGKAGFRPVSVRPALIALNAPADGNRFRRRIAASIPGGAQGRPSLVVCHGQRPSSRGRRISSKRRQPPYAAMCPRDA